MSTFIQATPDRLPTPETHPLLFRLAAEIGKPLAFFDLETTTSIVSKSNFGIAELAYLAILPDGSVHNFASYINPEAPMDPEAARITGIDEQALKSEKPFSSFQKRVRGLMEKSIMIGFNSNSFDIPGVLGQFDRYQIERPEHWECSDLRDIWRSEMNPPKGKGKLSEVAEHYGVPFEGAHRASADTFACVNVLERMLWRHGSLAFERSRKLDWDPSKPSASTAAGSAPSPSSGKPKELTAIQAQLKDLLDPMLAEQPPLSVALFAERLAAGGFQLEITQGGAAYVHAEERVSGSKLGQGYAWREVLARLSGPIPDKLFAPGAARFQPRSAGAPAPNSGASSPAASVGAPPSAAPRSGGSRESEDARARAAIAELASSGAPAQLPALARQLGIRLSALSFAASDALQKGQIQAQQLADADAQRWLSDHWAQLPVEGGRLKPLLEAAQKAGAPESIDYIQLRVALGARSGSSPAPRSAPQAPREPEASPHAAYEDSGSDEAVHAFLDSASPARAPRSPAPSIPDDDLPPFDEPYSGDPRRSAAP